MPIVATMSNTCFWLYTVSLLLVWIIVIATASPIEQKSVSAAKFWGKNQAQEQRLEKSCQAICEQCGCIGFYCGEQCLCEYDKHSSFLSGGHKRNSTNNRTLTNYECIATMQHDAQTRSLPFELIIQGPSSERFMRTAMAFELDGARAVEALVGTPKKRATISIYRPNVLTQSNALQQYNESRKSFKSAAFRPRRSTAHLDWFSDFANTLVRPAPLRKGKGVSGSDSGSTQKRETQGGEEDSVPEKPDSWFSDHPKRLLRPAPLFRRQKLQRSFSAEEEENNDRDSQEGVGEMIKNTLRNIQESGISDGIRAGLRDGTELLHNTLQDSNLELIPKRFRNDFAEVYDTWLQNQQPTEASLEVPAVHPRATAPVFLPWFRPVRFLQRVHQALN